MNRARGSVGMLVLLVGCTDPAPPADPTAVSNSATLDGTDDTSAAATSTTDAPTTGGSTMEATTDASTSTDPVDSATSVAASTGSDASSAADSSTTGPPAVCGDGIVEGDEACDDGDADNSDACSVLCQPPSCSDDIVSGDETGVDCGGGCVGCGVGADCDGDADCKSGACEAGQCAAGCVEWAHQWGTEYIESGTGIATDGADNVFVSGTLIGDVNGSVKKFDAKGKELWSKVIDAVGGKDSAYAITTDGAGSVFVTGQTNGDLDGNVNLGTGDAYIVKYDNAGAKVWTRQFGSIYQDYGYDITTDDTGNVIVAGTTSGTTDGVATAGGYDAFVTKFDAKGVKQWARLLGTKEDDSAYSVAANSKGDIYIAGYTLAGLDGNASLGDTDAFLAKYDANGVKQWTYQFGSNQGDYAAGVATDDADNVYVTGSVGGALDGNVMKGFSDIFLVKYDASDAKVWTRQLGSDDPEAGADLVVDGAGDVLIVGTAFGPLDGNVSLGGQDFFVTKYAASGVKQWTRQFGTKQDDSGASVAALSDGTPVIAGDSDGQFAQDGEPGDIVAALVCPP
jgi:cysteine-rich repeat protein